MRVSDKPHIDIRTKSISATFLPPNSTLKLGKLMSLPASGLRISLNLPNETTQLIVASNASATRTQHAVIVNLTKVLNTQSGDILYKADLNRIVNGTNPFTKKRDTVFGSIDLLLFNNGSRTLGFANDSRVTTFLIVPHKNITASPDRSSQIAIENQFIALTGSNSKNSSLLSKGVRHVLSVSPFVITNGSIYLMLPIGDVNLVASNLSKKEVPTSQL